MMRSSWALVRAVGATAVVLALAACSSTKDILRPKPIDPLFASVVSLGNSLTAGYQSGGINDSTQAQAYPVLLAAMMGTRFAYPALAMPGCPPPIDNFLTQARVGGGTSTSCSLRDPASVTGILNNVAVPGANSLDPTSPVGSGPNPLTTFILGGETQVQRALDAHPTFATVWIGNNDVLPAALSGILVPTPGVSPGVTDQATFATNINAMMSALTAAPTLKGGVLMGVVNVSNAPIFFPAALLVNSPQVKGAFDAAAGTTTTIDSSCTPTTTALIDFQLAGAIASGAHPPVIACAPNAIPGTPVGDIYVLDSTEQATVSAAVAAYNATIQAAAQKYNWVYYDPNVTLDSLRAAGAVPPFPDLTAPTAPFGAYFSLDGIHPTLLTHQLLAGQLAAAIDAKYGTHLLMLPMP